MSAGKAQSKVDPLAVRLEAFLAARRRAGLHIMNFIQMRTLRGHDYFSGVWVHVPTIIFRHLRDLWHLANAARLAQREE